jgi:hypothetical protein
MDIDEYLFQPAVDENEHIIATYYIESRDFLRSKSVV